MKRKQVSILEVGTGWHMLKLVGKRDIRCI